MPSAQWAEEEGSMTNLEGRVIRRRQACDPPAGVWDDVAVICELARWLGNGRHFEYDSVEEIFEESGQASAGGPADYSGISHAQIEANDGLFWPCPDPEHPGTPRMFTAGFPRPAGGRGCSPCATRNPTIRRMPNIPCSSPPGATLPNTNRATKRDASPNWRRSLPNRWRKCIPPRPGAVDSLTATPSAQAPAGAKPNSD